MEASQIDPTDAELIANALRFTAKDEACHGECADRALKLADSADVFARKTEVATACLAALKQLGEYWRGDWSEFDGRTLRSQLNSWVALFVNPETTVETVAEWVEDTCPEREW